ncbi:MAG: substrate-binding domain-containing protein [Verrucomicrobia bacterium]|nr:substrate-binding domain-containing protein [Verrucomicrobiota bacterium]
MLAIRALAGPEALPPPVPADGILRIAGNPELLPLVNRWAAEFQRRHPRVPVEVRLTGSDTGMAELYTGQANLVLLGREPTSSEVQAFEWVFRYRPTQVAILTGSLDRPGRSPALAIFVHPSNPLAKLSLSQLAAIFQPDETGGATSIRTWGQLGLGGDWTGRAIHLYAPDLTSGSGRFFRQVVLGDSRFAPWERLTEVSDTSLSSNDAGEKILAALARDPDGLAVAWLGCNVPGVRLVALQATAAATAVLPTAETLVDRTYPLTRTVWTCFHRPPGGSASPVVRDFLRLVLSPPGQGAANAEMGYLPLRAETAAAQARLVE